MKALNFTFYVAFFLTNLSCFNQSSSDLKSIDHAEAQRPTHEAFSQNLALATQGEATTRIGIEIARMGGNAIDVAAALSFAISVERPQSTGIGGGGFMLIYFAKTKETIAVDFREKAPFKARERMFQDRKGDVRKGLSIDGILAGATPGLVAGILKIHKKYGKLTRQQIIEPSIKLADKGFIIYDHLASAIAVRAEVLKKYPASTQIFFHPDGSPLKTGELLVQKDLAKTLREISKRGHSGFYKGRVAQAIINEERRLKGVLTQRDLDNYNVVFRKPIEGTYKGYEIYSMPPPSSGGVHVVEILNMLEEKKLTPLGSLNPTTIHITASAMQMAFADRARYLGDSDYVKVPVKGLTSKSYAKALIGSVDGKKSRPSQNIQAGPALKYESDETTHFSIMDAEGNTVSSTQTINGLMGSGVVIPGTGILMNNEMDDFSAKPGVANMFGAVGGKENAIQPGKRPLSSMSPTIVLKDGKPILAIGSPSGTRIITCVTLSLLNYLDYKENLYDSVAGLRYHHQWSPDVLMVEEPGFDRDTKSQLEAMGYKIESKDLGCKVQAVAWEEEGLHAVSDPRDVGQALGF